jgi:uncharacterized protein YndB with AHSA1/START domain
MPSADPTPPSEAAITLVRAFAAPPERVFAGWTDPAILRRWLAERAETEPRPGGRYRLETSNVEAMAGVHVCAGEYVEVDAPRRLVKTWSYSGPLSPAGDVRTLVTVDLRETAPGASELTLREEGPVLADATERRFALEAWSSALDSLADALAAGA